MKKPIILLVLVLSALALTGCASTCKKSSEPASQNAPATVTPVVASQPAVQPVATAEPVQEEIPAAKRKYVSK
jgi:PBP1b-binding outer membrane lipoprotein LpoB